MADTFSPGLKVRLPQTGAYNNVWGAVLNSDALNQLDTGITGLATITLTGLTYSLPALTNGAASDSRNAALRFIGSPSGIVTVTVPASVGPKIFLIDNQCGQAIIFGYTSGTTATVPAGVRAFLLCDGTNVLGGGGGAINADTLGGITSAYWARVARTPDEVAADTRVRNVFAGVVNTSPWVTVVEAPNTIIDCSTGNHQKLTLTGDRLVNTPANPADGQQIWLQVNQDSVGSRHLTWSVDFLFESGIAPQLASVAFGVDLFALIYDASTAKWLVGHFSSIANQSGAAYNITLSGNQQDVNLAALLGNVPVASTVTVTIAKGTILQAGNRLGYALDLSNVLPAGSVLNLVNLGYILGRAGRGGRGGTMSGGNIGTSAIDGEPGGAALRGPGSGITFNINNASGFIWGAGGGGGGGGPSASVGVDLFAKGGGGGAGAGGGEGGAAGSFTNGSEVPQASANRASDGGSSATGIVSVPGAAGPGASRGVAFPASGGAAGDWGVAGSDGEESVSTFKVARGLGGAAGKAIELGGGGVPSFAGGSGSPNLKGLVA